MSGVIPITRDEARLEAACRWVLKIDEGLNANERKALRTWLAEHPSHSRALLDTAAVWDKTESLARLADLFPSEAATKQASSARRAALRWPGRLAVAASLMLIVIAGILLRPHFVATEDENSVPMQSAAYQTGVGEQKTVLLPDGSEVVLNTDSALAIAFTRNARVLQLTRGEIYVTVAKDPARPLSVVADNHIVQAVGTEFAVEITEDQHVQVVVTEGKVVVGIQPVSMKRSGRIRGAVSSRRVEGEAVVVPPLLAQVDANTLSAGEEMVLGEQAGTKKPVSASDIEVKVSWKDGRLIFKSEPLRQALDEVERYTEIEFVILDEDLNTRALTGRFKTGDVQTLLALLEANFGIVHEYDGDTRVLLSSL
tara:strand:+ start:4436 stop:5542 length:1107 start_codon:yes stop_codon:yes gene_type:complete